MNTTGNKRQRERARQDHQKAKADRRAQRRDAKPTESVASGEDPDIAGIVPGPQPIIED